jgi:hypothetical protein
MSKQVAGAPVVEVEMVQGEGVDLLISRPTVAGRSDEPAPLEGVVVGTLVALDPDGGIPLVVYEGQPTAAAQRARAILDLHGAHVGRDVLLTFENRDPRKPIVVGCLNDRRNATALADDDHVELDADGRRLVVTARSQLVLQCGKARITLTRCGKVLLEGTYISSRSSGVNRLKGGSVQLN